MSDPDGTEYAAAGAGIPGRGIEAWRSLSRALNVPLDVAVQALADGTAAAAITEMRGASCPGCGGSLRWVGESCFCGGRPGSRDLRPEPVTLGGVEALARLRRRYVPPVT